MTDWDLRCARDLAGERSLRLLAVSVGAGLALFAFDLAFACAMQGLLVGIGALPSSAARLPARLEDLGPEWIALGVLLIGALRAAGSWAQLYLQGASAEAARFHQRARIIRRTFQDSSASAAEAATMFTAYADSLGSTIGSAQSLCLQSTLCALLAASLAALAPALSASLALVLASWCWLLWAFDRRLRVAGEELRRRWTLVNGRLLAGIRNLVFLHAHGVQEAESDRAAEDLAGLDRGFLSFHFWSGLKHGANQLLAVVLLCAIVALRSSWRELPAGLLVAYVYLLFRFLQGFSLIHGALSNVNLCLPQVRALARWSERREPAMRPSARPVRLSAVPGWELASVDLARPGGGPALVRGLDLAVGPGEALALTGPSGSGKTTLIRLLLGFVAPDRGSVSLILEGQRSPLVGSLQERLLGSVGYVGSESFLIEGSVEANLRYGLSNEPTEDDIREALARAGCAFVHALPGGLRHRLDDQGQGLSAGEKQRLCLARALLRRPDVLILDEPTANLDAEAEAGIVSTLRGLKGRVTMVVATHHPSLVALAQRRFDFGSRDSAVVEA